MVHSKGKAFCAYLALIAEVASFVVELWAGVVRFFWEENCYRKAFAGRTILPVDWRELISFRVGRHFALFVFYLVFVFRRFVHTYDMYAGIKAFVEFV